MAAAEAVFMSPPNILQATSPVRQGGDGAVDGDAFAVNSHTAKIPDTSSATRVYSPRSFERPTENFTRKTCMRDRGPPGFEYNDTKHRSIAYEATLKTRSAIFPSASGSRSPPILPGVHVHSYPASPTREDRVGEANRAAQMRAEHAQRLATKARRDKNLAMARNQANSMSSGKVNSHPVISTSPVRTPRPRALEEKAWQEALKAKAEAISASPREQQQSPKRRGRGGGAASSSVYRKAVSKRVRKGVFQGVRMPSDRLSKSFAGGTELDALPGRLESVLFPERYVDWPCDKALPALARDVASSPVRYAVAFRSTQPRIMLEDAHKETHGWSGPGAYEWDGSIPPTNGNEDNNANLNHGSSPGGTGALRPKGIAVRDPSRKSASFRPESSAFIAPSQANVREYAAVPSSDAFIVKDGGREEEGGRQTSLHNQNRGRGGTYRRKRPRRLWMFQPPGKEYVPALATEGWDGPGAYGIYNNTSVSVREPGRLSLVFQEGGGRRGPSSQDRNVVGFPARPYAGSPRTKGLATSNMPIALAECMFSPVVFKPPESKTIAHKVRTNPVRFSSSFLSVTDRFDPIRSHASTTPETASWVGPGDVGRGGVGAGAGGYRWGTGNWSGGGREDGVGRGRGYHESWGPVERYDLVSARQRPAASKTWLGTSIRPYLRYNPSPTRGGTPANAAATVTATAENATTAHSQPSTSSPLYSSQAHSREDDVASKDECKPNMVPAELMSTADTSAGKIASIAEGGGDGVLSPAKKKGMVDISGTPAPSSPTAVDAGGNKQLSRGAIDAVAGDMRARGGMLLATQAVKAADVAAAIAGLAQDWPGCRRSGEGVVEQRERAVSGDSQGVKNNINGPSFVNASRERTTQTQHIFFPEQSQERGKGKMEPTQRGTSAHAQSGPRESRSSTRESERLVATIALPIEHSDPSLAPTSRRADPQRRGKIVAGDKSSIISVDATLVDQHSDAAGTGASGTRIGIEAGETPEERQPTCSPTHLTSSHSASSAVPTSVSGVGIARDKSSRALGGGLFLRTIGRPKRGPCMLTISSSRHSDDDNEKIRATHSTINGNKSRKKRAMWEAEASGGLVGPGEIRVLVC